MLIGTKIVTLHIPHSQSLKEKRKVVQSLIKRLKNTFEVLCIEVDTRDKWQIATLGICAISREQAVLDHTLSKVRDFIDKNATEYLVTNEVNETFRS